MLHGSTGYVMRCLGILVITSLVGCGEAPELSLGAAVAPIRALSDVGLPASLTSFEVERIVGRAGRVADDLTQDYSHVDEWYVSRRDSAILWTYFSRQIEVRDGDIFGPFCGSSTFGSDFAGIGVSGRGSERSNDDLDPEETVSWLFGSADSARQVVSLRVDVGARWRASVSKLQGLLRADSGVARICTDSTEDRSRLLYVEDSGSVASATISDTVDGRIIVANSAIPSLLVLGESRGLEYATARLQVLSASFGGRSMIEAVPVGTSTLAFTYEEFWSSSREIVFVRNDLPLPPDVWRPRGNESDCIVSREELRSRVRR